MNELALDNFKEIVLENEKLTIVDFWAPWCGPCKVLLPIIDKVSENRTDVNVYKVNVDEHNKLAAEYNIRSIPTLLFFKGGKLFEKTTGAKTESEINLILDSIK